MVKVNIEGLNDLLERVEESGLSVNFFQLVSDKEYHCFGYNLTDKVSDTIRLVICSEDLIHIAKSLNPRDIFILDISADGAEIKEYRLTEGVSLSFTRGVFEYEEENT